MKCLLVSALCVSFVISILAAPQVNLEDDNESFVTEDDVARKVIADQLEVIEKMTGRNEIARALLKSIDQECMFQKYKKLHLVTEMLTSEAVDFENLGMGLTKIDPIMVFANIALTCSKKLNPVLGFIFDNSFSYSGLLDAFREDEPFKKYLDDVVCYNNYAVKEDVLPGDLHVNFKHELTNHTEAYCEQEIKDLKRAVRDITEFLAEFIVTDHYHCLENEIAASAEKFFLKYALLIPLGLSDEEKSNEKAKFLEDAHLGLEKLLACNVAKEGEKINEITEN